MNPSFQYFSQAFNFLFKNKHLLFVGVVLSVINSALNVLVNNSIDPYYLLSFLGFAFIFPYLTYFLYFPLFINAKEKSNKLNLSEIKKIVFKNAKRGLSLMGISFIMIAIFLLGLFILFDSFLQIKVTEQFLLDTTKTHGFVYLPLAGLGMFMMELISFPIYLFMIMYLLEKKTLFFSLKRSYEITFRNWGTIRAFIFLPALIISFFYIFIPDGNYLSIFSNLLSDLLMIFLMTITYFFYKEKYKIVSVKENRKEEEKVNKVKKIFYWILANIFVLFIQFIIFILYVILVSDIGFKLDPEVENSIVPYVFASASSISLSYFALSKLRYSLIKLVLIFLLGIVLSVIGFVAVLIAFQAI